MSKAADRLIARIASQRRARHVGQRRRVLDAGVVDQDVQRPGAQHLVHHALHLRRIAEVVAEAG